MSKPHLLSILIFPQVYIHVRAGRLSMNLKSRQVNSYRNYLQKIQRRLLINSTSFSRPSAVIQQMRLCLAEENNITLEETPLKTIHMPSENLFSFRTVTSEERRVISSLPLNKSPGPDKINSRILKDRLPVILGPLTNIINCSLTTCTFPTA